MVYTLIGRNPLPRVHTPHHDKQTGHTLSIFVSKGKYFMFIYVFVVSPLLVSFIASTFILPICQYVSVYLWYLFFLVCFPPSSVLLMFPFIYVLFSPACHLSFLLLFVDCFRMRSFVPSTLGIFLAHSHFLITKKTQL